MGMWMYRSMYWKSLDIQNGNFTTRQTARKTLRGRSVRLKISLPAVSWLSIKCGIFDVSKPYRPPRPITRIDLRFYFIIMYKIRFKNSCLKHVRIQKYTRRLVWFAIILFAFKSRGRGKTGQEVGNKICITTNVLIYQMDLMFPTQEPRRAGCYGSVSNLYRCLV
jgi:hypothetical protein